MRRNTNRAMEAMATYAATAGTRRAVIVTPPIEAIDLQSPEALEYARFWRRAKVQEFVDAGHLVLAMPNVAVWTREGIENSFIRGRSRKNRSPLDYWLMDWEKIQKSTPINRITRLVTMTPYRVSLSAP